MIPRGAIIHALESEGCSPADALRFADAVVAVLEEQGSTEAIGGGERASVVAVDRNGDVASVVLPEWAANGLPSPEDFAARYPGTVGYRARLILDDAA